MANWEKLNKEFDDALDSMTKEDWDNWYKNVEQKQINQNKMKEKDYTVKEDMICPVTKSHCDDECCPVGATCNISSLTDMIESGEVSPGCEPERVLNLTATPIGIGGYRLGTPPSTVTLRLTHRPKWLHRTMMKLCFGVVWIDDVSK